MKKKILAVSMAIAVISSLSAVMVSPVLADEPVIPATQKTISVEEQQEALKYGQTGSAAPGTSVMNSIPEDYMIALSVGVVPSDEYAQQVCEQAKQEFRRVQSQEQQPTIYYATVEEWKLAGCPCATWTQKIVVGAR